MSARVFGSVVHLPATIPPGRLYGTTREAGLPDAPVRRRVQVVSADQNAHAHLFPTATVFCTWVWADENGSWAVHGLDPALKYHVIAYDHTGVHDPVIKMNLVPTVD